MKRTKKLKNKIIFYVMAVSVLLAACVVKVMSEGSIRSTNAVVLDNMQITARIAAQERQSPSINGTYARPCARGRIPKPVFYAGR